jgi:hypothetical protein
MKNLICLAIFASTLALTSCEQLQILGSDPANDTAFLTDTGPWTVSYFFDKDQDETSDFNGYQFYFEDNNIFKAVLQNGTVVNGTWNRTTDDNLPRLVISISGNDRLDELQDDWVLLKMEDKLIELEDDNTTEVEQLHFSR